MNFRIISLIQIFLTAFLLIASQFNSYSQDSDSTRIVKPGLFVGFGFGPSRTSILNEGMLSVANLVSTSRNSFGGSLDFGYFFTRHIGVSSGIGYTSYKTQVTLGTYQNSFNTTDSENEAYERRVSGTNIEEIQKIGFLNLPICLDIRLPLNTKIGYFLQTGINLAIPINKKYTSSGTFTFKGYYPAYNVLLENLPAYGFPSNIKNVANGELAIKSLNVNMIAATGFDFFIQKNMQIAVAATYSKSLSNVSAYSSPEKFQLSSEANQINSLMGGSNKVTVQSIGLNIRLRYFLKSTL